MISCEAVAEFLLEADLSLVPESREAAHVDSCPHCMALWAQIKAQERQLADEIAALALTVAEDVELPPQDDLAPRLRVTKRAAWRVAAPLAAATLGALLLVRPGEPPPPPFLGPPEWTLPDVSLQSTHPVVIGSDTHEWVAVLPTDNPNLTVVWFAN